MAITETLELQEKLHEQLGRDLRAIVVNGVLPQRFSEPELGRLAQLGGASDGVIRSAAVAARAVHDRAHFQRNQVARLRRRHFEVLPIPFQFDAELDLAVVQRIAAHLERKL
jgi:hypothetical protein